MTLTGNIILLYLVLGCLAIIGLFWLAIRIAYKDGWNDRGLHEQDRRNERAIRAQTAPRTPTMLVQPAEWQVYQPGRHAPFQPRVTVTRDTIAFAGGPATVPIAHYSRTPSGELRALTARADRFIEDMNRDGNAYRRQLAGSGPRGNSFANGATNYQGPAMAGHVTWEQAELMASQPNQWRDGQ